MVHQSVADDGRSGDWLPRHSGYDSVVDVLDVLDWDVCCEPMLDVLHRFRRGLCFDLHPFFLVIVLIGFCDVLTRCVDCLVGSYRIVS